MATDATIGVEKYIRAERLRESEQKRHNELISEVNRLWHENQALKRILKRYISDS